LGPKTLEASALKLAVKRYLPVKFHNVIDES
jgi:hypothetical protein